MKIPTWSFNTSENHSNHLLSNHFVGQDIEWARDGDDGKLYIVQARPETVASQKKVGVIEEYKMLEKGTLEDVFEYGKQPEFSTK